MSPREIVRGLPTPVRQLAQVFVPTGKHRPTRPAGALVEQRFAVCARCEVETALTVHGGVTRCTEGHIVAAGGAL